MLVGNEKNADVRLTQLIVTRQVDDPAGAGAALFGKRDDEAANFVGDAAQVGAGNRRFGRVERLRDDDGVRFGQQCRKEVRRARK